MPTPAASNSNPDLRELGATTAQWHHAREGIAEEERRISVDEMQKMDETRPSERPDWPLVETNAEKSLSPETPGDGTERHAWIDDEGVMGQRRDVEKRPSGGELATRDSVSDIDVEDERGLMGDNNFRREQMVEDESTHNPGMLGRSERLEVSPDRWQGHETAIDDLQDAEKLTSPETDFPAVQTSSPPLSQVSPVSEEHPMRSSTSMPDEQQEEEPQRTLEHTNAQRRTSIESIGSYEDFADRLGAHRKTKREEDGHPQPREQEVVEAAVPVDADSQSQPDQEPSTPHSHAAAVPLTNGDSTPPTGSDARSSLATEDTPHSHSNSPSSNHQGPQVSNRGRVRYSWQSLPDDEPNRPRIHIIKLVSEVATASAGFPGGEAFGFSISPDGRRIAAYNSSRLYVLQTSALPVCISQDYALKRRPLAVEIIDGGNVMAILADAHTVNVYDLSNRRPRRTRTVKLDFPSNCIALAPTGGLLAAAYEGGVEVFSLDPRALPTDRRAVRSQRMDRLAFSQDCSTLLGTTIKVNISSTVVVSVPVFPASSTGVPTHEELKEAWCSGLLQPENIKNSSHAVFMRENRQSCNDRVFAWNGLADSFGILNIPDVQYGNIDFPVVIYPPLSTCGGLGAAIHSCPAIDEHGDTVAMIVNDRTIRLYIVPHNAEDDETTIEAHSIDHELDEGYGCPFSEVRWMFRSASVPLALDNQSQVQGRLVVTSPGGVPEQGMGEEYVDDIEGGRIVLFDFDSQFAGQPGQTFSLALGKSPPQVLEEEEANVADQVALLRRRTVNQSKSRGLSQRPASLGRSASMYNRGRPSPSTGPSLHLSSSRRNMVSIHPSQSEAARSIPDLMETNENEAFEEPYVQNAPRSGVSLQRAATNAQRHRFQALEERDREGVSADSTGNFLPLPEYTEEPNAPLPSRFRAMAGLDAPPQPPPKLSPAVASINDGTSSSALPGPTGFNTAAAGSSNSGRVFRGAQASPPTYSRQRPATAVEGTPPSAPSVRRTETFHSTSSTSSTRRSLQRAHSIQISPLGSGLPPQGTGNWVNRSADLPSRSRTSRNGTLHNPRSSIVAEQPWDVISPVTPPSQASPPFGRSQQASSPQLYSPTPIRPPNYALHRSRSSGSGPFRNTARATVSPYPFPPTTAPEYGPLRTRSTTKPAPMTHPPAAWRSPTSSIPPASSGSTHIHRRRSTLASRSAFASTSKAKKLGFFARKKSQRFISRTYSKEHADGSTGRRTAKGESKCKMM